MRGMKKRIVFSILFLAVICCLAACNKTTGNSQTLEVSKQKEKDEKEEIKKDEESVTKQGETEEPDDGDDMQETVEQPTNIILYCGNDDATAFTSEEVQINSLSPEEVLNALIEKGAIAADVEILSFETTTVDGKSTILLDFNDAFASYISSMGSTGEYFVMGSICNTFLDAYDCEQIQVTVDGDTLSTGHAEYPGYMTTFS